MSAMSSVQTACICDGVVAGTVACTLCVGGKYSTTAGATSASTCLNCPLPARVSKVIEDHRATVAAAATGSCRSQELAAVIIRHHKLWTQLEKFPAEHADDVAARARAHHDEECPVCLDEIGHGGDLMLTRCGHRFHVDCLIETLSDGSVRSCPICRTDIAEAQSLKKFSLQWLTVC